MQEIKCLVREIFLYKFYLPLKNIQLKIYNIGTPYNANSQTVIYKSEPITNTLEPVWKAFKLDGTSRFPFPSSPRYPLPEATHFIYPSRSFLLLNLPLLLVESPVSSIMRRYPVSLYLFLFKFSVSFYYYLHFFY